MDACGRLARSGRRRGRGGKEKGKGWRQMGRGNAEGQEHKMKAQKAELALLQEMQETIRPWARMR